MQRQSNRYERLADTRYVLHIGGKTPMRCVFGEDVYHNVKVFNWSHRGRGVIKNEFNETFGAVVAYTYGYDVWDWTRKVANDDYTAGNFCLRSEQEHNTDVTADATIKKRNDSMRLLWAKQYDPMGVPFMERVKYKTKYECDIVTIPRFDSLSDIKIHINRFLVQYIPVTVGMKNGAIVCKDGTLLKVLLLEKLGVEINVRRYWSNTNIQDEFDLRIDPNDTTFCSRNIDRVRHHYICDTDTGVDERYVVIEVRENVYNNRFRWMAGHDDKWRLPYGHTVHEPRVSYVVVDEDVFERIDETFYDDRAQEWLVRDSESMDLTETGFVKPIQLKRLVAEMAGLNINNVYIQPELNSKYKKALECTADLTTPEGRKAARRRYLYENHASIDSGQAMYKPAKLVKRRQVVADKQYFCTSIYGGVGVWCFDLRKCSVRLRGIQAPEQDNAEPTTKGE